MRQHCVVHAQTDSCPECEPNHLDLQALTWAKVRNGAITDVAQLLHTAIFLKTGWLKNCCFCTCILCILGVRRPPLVQDCTVCTSEPDHEVSSRRVLVRCHPPQIANPSPGGGRINLQYRRVECAPPSDLVVNVDANDGGDRWIRLSIQVRFAVSRLKVVGHVMRQLGQ